MQTHQEDLGMTKCTEARNNSAWQETKTHLMLLKYEVQSSKWQKNAGEVDTVKITKRLSSILRTLGFFLYIVVGHSDGS